MADETPQPHDAMVRAVLSDLSEARSFLQRYMPEELSRDTQLVNVEALSRFLCG